MADATDTAERVTEIGRPEPVDRDDHRVATVVGVVALLVVVLVGVVGLGRLVSERAGGTPVAQVVVPRLSDRTMTEAQSELERLGLIVDMRFEPNEIVAPDVVVDQEPIAGARLEVGEQVVLIVSDGPVGITVPDLSGAQVPDAERTLGVLGLKISLREQHHEEVTMGEIVRSDPPAGSRTAPDSTVTVLVSLGPRPRVVPDVVGMSVHEGFLRIGRADLQIARVTERYAGADDVGKVLSVDPVPGTEVPRDQPIRVVVGAPADSAETVPDVSGLTEVSARAALRNEGFGVSVRAETVPAGDRRVGRVIRQSPVAGSPTEEPVTLWVGVAAAAPTTAAPTTAAPTTTSPP